jgi:hypothetical protein
MKITDELHLIKFDAMNFAIGKYSEKNEFKAIGYYGTVEGAFKGVLKNVLMDSVEAFDAQNVINAISELNERVETLCKSVSKEVQL